MNAPVAVIDTNVLVAGLITGDEASPTARIVDAMMRGSFPFLLSVDLLAEYRAVLLRPKIRTRHGLEEREVDAFLEVIAANGIVRELATASARGAERAGGRGDEHVWALLAAHPGAVLVTGDEALLAAGSSRRVETPATFAARLTALDPAG